MNQEIYEHSNRRDSIFDVDGKYFPLKKNVKSLKYFSPRDLIQKNKVTTLNIIIGIDTIVIDEEKFGIPGLSKRSKDFVNIKSNRI